MPCSHTSVLRRPKAGLLSPPLLKLLPLPPPLPPPLPLLLPVVVKEEEGRFWSRLIEVKEPSPATSARDHTPSSV